MKEMKASQKTNYFLEKLVFSEAKILGKCLERNEFIVTGCNPTNASRVFTYISRVCRFRVVSTWNTRGVFVNLSTYYKLLKQRFKCVFKNKCLENFKNFFKNIHGGIYLVQSLSTKTRLDHGYLLAAVSEISFYKGIAQGFYLYILPTAFQEQL